MHHHFPQKSVLAAEMIGRYRERFAAALAGIDARGGLAAERLEAYVALYREAIGAEAAGGSAEGVARPVCLCVSLGLAGDRVPEPVRGQLRGFHRASLGWLRALIAAGEADGSLAPAPDPRAWARGVLASMEGAQISARLAGGRRAFDPVAAEVLRNATRA